MNTTDIRAALAAETPGPWVVHSTWLAELLAEVDRLREDARAFAEALGFGDGRTEPAATLAQMIDPLTEAMSMARDHIECAVMCELCGEVLAGERCEECHGSGCLPNAELTYLECGTCAGAGRIHVGCAEASYAGLAARAEAAEQAIQRVRELHTPEVAYDSEHHDCEPSECDRAGEGKPYERCAHCSGFAWEQLWPCSTIRALDGGEQ